MQSTESQAVELAQRLYGVGHQEATKMAKNVIQIRSEMRSYSKEERDGIWQELIKQGIIQSELSMSMC